MELKLKKFTYYDSLNMKNKAIAIGIFLKEIFKLIFDFYFYDYDDITDWNLELITCPQQENNNDCGVFICKFIEYISFGKAFDFNHKDMDYFRVLIGIQLIKMELL